MPRCHQPDLVSDVWLDQHLRHIPSPVATLSESGRPPQCRGGSAQHEKSREIQRKSKYLMIQREFLRSKTTLRSMRHSSPMRNLPSKARSIFRLPPQLGAWPTANPPSPQLILLKANTMPRMMAMAVSSARHLILSPWSKTMRIWLRNKRKMLEA